LVEINAEISELLDKQVRWPNSKLNKGETASPRKVCDENKEEKKENDCLSKNFNDRKDFLRKLNTKTIEIKQRTAILHRTSTKVLFVKLTS